MVMLRIHHLADLKIGVIPDFLPLSAKNGVFTKELWIFHAYKETCRLHYVLRTSIAYVKRKLGTKTHHSLANYHKNKTPTN